MRSKTLTPTKATLISKKPRVFEDPYKTHAKPFDNPLNKSISDKSINSNKSNHE
jgi:hypothetical protein